MNSFNSLRSRSLERFTIIAAAVFALTVGSSSAVAQRGGGGHVGGGGGGHVPGGGGDGGGRVGGGGQPTGRGHPTSGEGHRQGRPRSGPDGAASRPDSIHSAGTGGGRGSDGRHSDGAHRHFDGRGADHHDHHFDHGDHRPDFDHHHGGDFDRHHRDHHHDFDHHHRVFYYDPFFWDYDPYFGYPYYPYYPYFEYTVPSSDYSVADPPIGVSRLTDSAPSATENGGISFSVTPADAFVYVDDNYAGIASSFGTASPLSLPAGSHGIELVATGYVPMAFEVKIAAGQVVARQVSLTPEPDR